MTDDPKKKLPRTPTIVAYIRDNAPIRGCKVVEDLAKDPYNIPSSTTQAYLTNLTKQNVLTREGTRRNYVYSVPKSA